MRLVGDPVEPQSNHLLSDDSVVSGPMPQVGSDEVASLLLASCCRCRVLVLFVRVLLLSGGPLVQRGPTVGAHR
jgi:hypothetical protein